MSVLRFTRALYLYVFIWDNTQTAGNSGLGELAPLLIIWLLKCDFSVTNHSLPQVIYSTNAYTPCLGVSGVDDPK